MRGARIGVAIAAIVAAAGVALAAGEPFAGRDGGDPGGPGGWRRFSQEDRAAFADARVAALHAGLRLNADQEKLWPPVEDAMRNLGKVRREQWQARRERGGGQFLTDAPAALRTMADAQSARAEALRKLADAAQPLYATLDEGQKRRALVLARPPHRHGGPMGPMRGHREP